MDTEDRKPSEALRERPRLWNRIPASVFILGLLSLMMLIWTDQINQRLRVDEFSSDALRELRTTAATSHLWLEEGFSGGGADKFERAWTELNEATRLSQILLQGGDSGHGYVLAPLKDSKLQRQAEEITRLLHDLQATFRERVEKWAVVGSPLDKRYNSIFEEQQNQSGELDKLLAANQAANHARSRHLFYGMLVAWSSILGVSLTGLVRHEGKRRQAEEALRHAHDELEVRVAERTRELRRVNYQLILELTERQKTEESLRRSQEQLRYLSACCLTAQETERKRISAELHDELGHALVLLKFRVGLIRKALNGQFEAKEECEGLLQFIDQVIENVRRLSRELSPCLLEDMGLSEALRWLVGNYVGDHETEVRLSVPDLDRLFTQSTQTLLYRIIQEALTNIRKHARAKSVHLSVERRGNELYVAVDDDGAGFDMQQVAQRDARHKGFGLATMGERAQMLGGALKFCSGEGRGTHISLVVPLAEGQV